MMKVACPPGYGEGLSWGELRFVNWTRTYQLPFSDFASNVHGVVAVQWLFTSRFATSMAPDLSSAVAVGTHEAKTSVIGPMSAWRAAMKPNVRGVARCSERVRATRKRRLPARC